jgi:hypothetical protein
LGGPFQDEKDFFGFIQGYGVNAKAIEQSGLPLLFGMEFNFRIVSTGLAANVKREITAITYDYANLTGTFADMLDKQDQDKGKAPETPTTPPPTPPNGQPPAKQKTKIQASKGRPSIVYWEEN